MHDLMRESRREPALYSTHQIRLEQTVVSDVDQDASMAAAVFHALMPGQKQSEQCQIARYTSRITTG
jgi:hypothetical protein